MTNIKQPQEQLLNKILGYIRHSKDEAWLSGHIGGAIEHYRQELLAYKPQEQNWEGEFVKLIKKVFDYTDLSGDIGKAIWVKRNTDYDYGNIENDFRDLKSFISNLISNIRREAEKSGIRLFRDGDKWCCLWGENLQEGVCGFGDYISQATDEFVNEFVRDLDKLSKYFSPKDIIKMNDQLYREIDDKFNQSPLLERWDWNKYQDTLYKLLSTIKETK